MRCTETCGPVTDVPPRAAKNVGGTSTGTAVIWVGPVCLWAPRSMGRGCRLPWGSSLERRRSSRVMMALYHLQGQEKGVDTLLPPAL